jgi:outer membrane immunogenic protein
MRRWTFFFVMSFIFSLALEAYVQNCGFDWSGAYIGGNIGYDWRTRTGTRDDFSSDFTPLVLFGNNVPASFKLRSNGAVGGGQIGFNLQRCSLVIGGEADFQNGFHKKQTIELPAIIGFTPSTSIGKSGIDWFGTVRGRLGWTFCRRLFLFGTGGYAYGKVRDHASLIFTPVTDGVFEGERRTIKHGWVAGGGAELGFCRCLSVKLEYLYIDLGRNTVTLLDPLGFPDSFIKYEFVHRNNILRTGVNYHF